MDECAIDKVRDCLDKAIVNGHVCFNAWYKPNTDAIAQLTKEEHIGRIPVGYSYRGHLFTLSDDLLICLGEI